MPRLQRINIYTDGGSRSNPGPSAIAVIICDDEGNCLKEHSDYIGDATNNIAEYRAIICALELGTSHCRKEVRLYSDSQLAVRQLNKDWRINAPHLRDLALEVEAKTRLYQKVSFAFVSREHPIIARADELVNEELDKAVGPGSRVR